MAKYSRKTYRKKSTFRRKRSYKKKSRKSNKMMAGRTRVVRQVWTQSFAANQ